MPIGVFILHNADPLRFKLAIGAFLTAYGLFGLLTSAPHAFTRGGRGLDAFAGLIGGVLGGLAGMSGIVPAIWTQFRGWKRDLRRATMQVYNIAMQVTDADGLLAHRSARRNDAEALRGGRAGDAASFLFRDAPLRALQRKDVCSRHFRPTAGVGGGVAGRRRPRALSALNERRRRPQLYFWQRDE